jgi:glutamine amidotransferase
MMSGVIGLIDYGAGNLTSVRKALAALDARVRVPQTPRELADVAALIVPGVGNFKATSAMTEEWRDAILSALGVGRPLLGICLGLQWLFEGSTEAPECSGLGLMNGRCDRLPSQPIGLNGERPLLKIPHVGWNALHFPRLATLFTGIDEGAQVYFTHSYAAPVTEDAAAVTTYGVPFASAVERGQVFGVQFHPEKSGDIGLQVLRNFLANM